MQEADAGKLVQGLIATTHPGKAFLGCMLAVAGVMAAMLAALVLLDPLIHFIGLRALNPVAFALALLGGIVMAAAGVSMAFASRKARRNWAGTARTWKNFLSLPDSITQ